MKNRKMIKCPRISTAGIITASSSVTLYRDLVLSGASRIGCVLPHDLEAYLTVLLHRHESATDFFEGTCSERFLRAQNLSGRPRQKEYRALGDACLLLSGFFPARAHRLNVSDEYYRSIGRNSYDLLCSDRAMPNSDLFRDLSCEFILLTRVLSAITTV